MYGPSIDAILNGLGTAARYRRTLELGDYRPRFLPNALRNAALPPAQLDPGTQLRPSVFWNARIGIAKAADHGYATGYVQRAGFSYVSWSPPISGERPGRSEDAAKRESHRGNPGHDDSGLYGCRRKSSADTSSAGMIGAGEGNRTLVCSLGSCRSTIELHPLTGPRLGAYSP
jgi:hypothetical protein